MTGVLILGLLVGPQDPPPATHPKPPEPSPALWEDFHGDLRIRYRARWTGDASDSDLYEHLSLSYGDPKHDLLTAALSARIAEDLDGERDSDGFYAFDSLDDSYRHGSTARLLTAYFDLNQPVEGLWVRGGRQVLDAFPVSVPMDGGLVQHSGLFGFSAAAFAGVPVNLFESSPSGDLMYGGWLETVPWRGARGRIEFLHLEDENVFGAFDDDLVGFVADHRFGPIQTHGRYSLLEGKSYEATGRATSSFADLGLIVDAQLNYLFERQQALSYAIDPYSLFLMEIEPYAQGSLRASKTVGGPFAVDVSLTVRELVEDDDEGAYNREFLRWNVTPRADGWPHATLSAALIGDYWKSTADDFWTLGGELAWKPDPSMTWSLGSTYALYAVDTFTGEERERVRTIYAGLRWRLDRALTLEGRFAFEENEVDRFRTAELGVRHAF